MQLTSRPRSVLPGPGVIVPSLDGLRGIAPIMVLLFHYEVRRFHPTSLAGGIFSDGVHLGWIGLDLFFVLSGFLITGILLDSKSGAHYFRNFYARRAVRILPLYYGFLLLLFVIVPNLPGIDHAAWRVPFSTQAWYWTHTTNFLFAARGWAAAAPYTPHLWSLALEEQFYLAWPTIVYLCSRRQVVIISAATVVGSFGLRVLLLRLGMDPSKVDVLTFTRLDGIAFGAFLAAYARGPGGFEFLRRWAPTVAIGSAVMLAGILYWRGVNEMLDFVVQTAGITTASIGIGALILMLLTTSPTSIAERTLTAFPLQWLGKHSYAMYVFHYPVMGLLDKHGFAIEQVQAMVGGSNALANVVYVAVNATITMGVSILSWHLIERPGLRLKRLFPYASASGPAKVPAAAPTATAGDGMSAPTGEPSVASG